MIASHQTILCTITATVGVVFQPTVAAGSGVSFHGPIPYLCESDSPFDLSDLGRTFFLEDFEDGTLNPEVVASSGQPVGPGPFRDSVDCDDGLIDGSGTAGWAYFADSSNVLVFTFDAAMLGSFPNEAGLVFTDLGVHTTSQVR